MIKITITAFLLVGSGWTKAANSLAERIAVLPGQLSSCP